MHRLHVPSVLLVALGLVVPMLAAPPVAASPTTRTLVFVECWAGMSGDAYRTTGHLGRIEHASGVITWDVYVYDAAAGSWSWAGTDENPSWDLYNAGVGVEVFRGQFNFASPVFGTFSGSFTWHEGVPGAQGRSDGRATDGTGRLWKATLGSVDPAAYLPLPSCAGEPEEAAWLNEAQLITP